MNKLYNITFYTSLAFILISLVFRALVWPGHALFILVGLSGISIIFIIKSISTFLKTKNIISSLFFISIGLMSATLFFRYYHWRFWDIPGFITLPFFILTTFLYFRNHYPLLAKEIKPIVITIIYIGMSIPLFLTYNNSPRKYIPNEWLPQSIDNENNRNENWAWFIDKPTGKGMWVPIGPKNTLDEGKYTLFFSNGNIREIGKIKNGKNIDTTFIYDIHENLIRYTLFQKDTSYNHYVMDGDYFEYYKTGELKEEGVVKNHKQSNNWISYYLSGQTLMKNYTKGELSVKMDFYKNGQKKDSVIYQNDMQNGPAFFWYENGQLKGVSYWKNNIQDSSYIVYFENGLMKEKTMWSMGKKNGKSLLWYENGNLSQRGSYIDDLPNGYFEQYYENGNIQFKGNFINYKKDGICYSYFENGNIQSMAKYLNGKQNGLTKIYNENGELIEEANYKNDLPHGKVKTYENGNLIQSDIYENGEFIETNFLHTLPYKN